MENIITFSHVEFNPLEPEPDGIKVVDIAHALSQICRAGGHYSEFYSVAAHCLNCFDEAVARMETPRVRMACLLHDASEAYLSDITRPVKKNLKDYLEIEEKLQNAIYLKFLGSPLDDYEKQMVQMIDDTLFEHEFYEFTAIKVKDELPFVAAQPDFFKGTMKQVEVAFIEAFGSIDLNAKPRKTEGKATIKWIR